MKNKKKIFFAVGVLVAFLLCMPHVRASIKKMTLKQEEGRSKAEWLIVPQYHNATSFVDGVAWVQAQENGPWQQIDRQGTVCVDNVNAFRVGALLRSVNLSLFVDQQWQHGALNRSGDVRIRAQYAQIDPFVGNVASAAIKDKSNRLLFGAINERGETILPFRYEEGVVALSNDLFSIRKGDKWGAINAAGQGILAFEYGAPIRLLPGSDYLVAPVILEEPLFTEMKGLVLLKPGERKVRILDKKGRRVLPETYESVSFGEGIFSVEKKGRLTFLDKEGEALFIGNFYTHSIGITNDAPFSEGLAVVRLEPAMLGEGGGFPSQRSAVIDKKGALLFEFNGAALSPYKRGLLLVLEAHGDGEDLVFYDSKGKRFPLPSGLSLLEKGGDAFDGETLVVREKKSGKVGFLKINDSSAK